MEILKWEKLLSSERLFGKHYNEETDYDARTEFQRDIDRIVFSSAFRRLQDKTQVMPLPDSDYVRSRLTHSIEVASLGRSLGKLVGSFIIKKEQLDSYTADDFGNVVAAACLAHDIGNPPFGHSGEKAISNFFAKYQIESKDFLNLSDSQKRDFLKFEGNAAGFRLLTNDHPSGRKGGLRLTYATLGTFIKYPKGSVDTVFNDLGNIVEDRKSQSKFNFFQQEKDLFVDVAEKLGLLKLSDSSQDPAYCRHPLSFLMEAADTIAYSIIDFEDGHKLGYISTQDAISLLSSIVNRTTDTRCDKDDWQQIDDDDEKIGALRAKAINSLLYECRNKFIEEYDNIMAGKFDQELPSVIASSADLKEIKDMSFKQYYQHSNVIDIELAGFEVLGGLLDLFTGIINTKKHSFYDRLQLKMSEQFRNQMISEDHDFYTKLLVCSDFISRMTDSHAMKLYRKLKGINL